jgi:flagellar biosynthesis protein FlhB
MSKQEIKDEFRQAEGDPMIKARIRQIQREMARRRMFESIPKATVVITNPTHVAVALEYKDGMQSPVVLAKGERVIAEKIKEVARKHNVPIVENPPLARTLLKQCPVGAPISPDLFEAVAEVLAFVYRMNRKKSGASAS